MPSMRSRALAVGFLSLAAYSASTASLAAQATAPRPDPRVGLRGGLMDAAEATWNLRVVSKTPPSAQFLGGTSSDLAFTGTYAIQGSYNGYQIWDISNSSRPFLKTAYYCPASQSDVSVYQHLLFVSGEGLTGRIDCGAQGAPEIVSKDRLRGIRIFDISDISHPKNVGNVQTCRGSHTHSVLVDPKDPNNVYVYISGSAGVRREGELSGCVDATPDRDPNSSLFRIEVIKVPLAHPELAGIVSSPRIFNDLVAPARHGETPADSAAAALAVAAVRAAGGFTIMSKGVESEVSANTTVPLLDSIVKARGGSGAATAVDSAALRGAIQGIMDRIKAMGPGPNAGPTQCHDITLYPAIGLAAGACGGYGLLIDIRNPAHPTRIGAVADSNFSYWHSATFNNDGSKVLFSDEWGGGSQPKCRVTDKPEWGADAIFSRVGGEMRFQSYYKMPAPQTAVENCVAHNGSLIPIPGRDVMVQAWYQGGISVFDWTDAAHPKEIAFFDRGPVDPTLLTLAGSWSVYWYNGVMVSSEIARGLDIFELRPSEYISENEIDAAKTVHYDYLNTQGQPRMIWPASFALVRAYADQLERSDGLGSDKIAALRKSLKAAEKASGGARRDGLTRLATELEGDARGARDGAKLKLLIEAVRELAAVSR